MAFDVTTNFAAGTKAVASEVNTNFDDIVDEINGTTTTANILPQIVPVGSILPWLKSLGSTPALVDGWVECNGQTISDAESIYDGVTIPDLNTTNNFLRGNSTSSLEDAGGTATHNHGGFTSITGRGDRKGTSSGVDSNSGLEEAGGSTIRATTQIISTVNNEPPYTNVVYIMRIK